MKPIVIMTLILSMLSVSLPVFANTRQENNANIAEYILDTLKLPLVLIGSFVRQDHEKAVKETQYKGHKGLGRAINRAK